MKKIKVLSLILALCMALSVFTIAATADENAETITIKKGQLVKYSVSIAMQQKFGAIDGRFFFDQSKFALLKETREDDIIIDPETGEKLFSDYHDYYSLSFPAAGFNDGTCDGENSHDFDWNNPDALYLTAITNYADVQNGEVWWSYIIGQYKLGEADEYEYVWTGLDCSQGTDLMEVVVEAKEDITCTRDQLNQYLRFEYEEMLNADKQELNFFGDANGKIDIEILDAPVETPDTDSDIVVNTDSDVASDTDSEIIIPVI